MRRLLLWLLVPALPLAVVLGLLALQDAPSPPRAIAPVEALPVAAPLAEPRAWDFPLRRSDGSPALDAVVIVVEPEVAQASVGADGRCHISVRAPGPVRVLAWAPGHQVREAGPWDSPPLELRLDAMEALAAPAEPLRLAPLRVRLAVSDGPPLGGALLVVRPEAQPAAAPWLAFADGEGVAVCEAEDVPLLVQVYAPGRAPRAPWLLASAVRAPGSEEWTWEIALARLEIAGLPPMEPVELRKDGETLDLLAAGEDGVARWHALAPGAWEVATAAGRMRLELAAGARRAAWAPDAAP